MGGAKEGASAAARDIQSACNLTLALVVNGSQTPHANSDRLCARSRVHGKHRYAARNVGTYSSLVTAALSVRPRFIVHEHRFRNHAVHAFADVDDLRYAAIADD